MHLTGGEGQAARPQGIPEGWADVAVRNAAECQAVFAAVADPFAPIEINPRDIRRRCSMHDATKRARGSKYHDWGRVIPGDWDVGWEGSPNPSLAETPKRQAVLRRYGAGVRWEDTGIVEAMLSRVARGESVHSRYTTADELLGHYRQLDRLFARIREDGFRLTQDVDGSFSNLFVSIGRTGELLLAKPGNHRLAIAVVLGLPRIPVYVLARHEAWQVTRDRVAALGPEWRGSVVPIAHPDLRGLDR